MNSSSSHFLVEALRYLQTPPRPEQQAPPSVRGSGLLVVLAALSVLLAAVLVPAVA
jgi:hypothetical protein